MTKIKICGVRCLQNALLVAEAGADMIGLNFYPLSPRSLELATARDIVAGLRLALGTDCPTLVGVFVNESAADVRKIMAAVDLDFAQLSGDETPETVAELDGLAFKSIRPRALHEAVKAVAGYAASFPADERAPSILVDAYHPQLYGGSGETASLAVAQEIQRRAPRLLLAGGLSANNVAERLRAIRPWGVDVASGVEAGQPGVKDERKLRAFIQAARASA
ncbi:MAG: phosphoribosylanthranilate isomerase [Chloroflexi bacterium]|nr:phosphoribosylanthranilate isomerase [Chloroflexota bacterium]MCY3582338.1 phosphoribosylanthranilate isomerase [Chloroflexota bacterium]MCY3717498.1 phosphoribosylanthranilate isomerase [Chloroflexota bacterium]MDE2652016.1 phosphoribosylanthranilate isomerase [Chloroflexota bacterium]MXV94048.1 phosphoribosylanthranilate isomerase [Chloroflexota bacterium]